MVLVRDASADSECTRAILVPYGTVQLKRGAYTTMTNAMHPLENDRRAKDRLEIWSSGMEAERQSLSLAHRDELLAAAASIAETLQSGADESDRQGKLSDEAVAALRTRGFWRLSLCRELGGLELPIIHQIEILAALAEIDASSAWCTMVANNGVAMLGATMPDVAIERIFADGIPPCSIVAAPGGVATPVEGGFRLSGTWRLASSIRHATWVHATAFVERDPSRLLPLAIPVRDVEVLDSWNVVGLSGTGSNDFKLTDYFLPAELAGREDGPYRPIRGKFHYDRVDVEHVACYEHLAFAIGMARRALRELRAMLAKPFPGRYICDREVVQEELGEAVVKVQAVEALANTVFARVGAAAAGQQQSWSTSERHLPRSIAAWATSLALECVQLAFRRSGLGALHKPNIFEKLLRDMSVAATHVVVDDSAFPSYAQHLIETGAPLQLDRQTSGT
jgi:indole-3-acetate monooxygenase